MSKNWRMHLVICLYIKHWTLLKVESLYLFLKVLMDFSSKWEGFTIDLKRIFEQDKCLPLYFGDLIILFNISSNYQLKRDCTHNKILISFMFYKTWPNLKF